MKNIYGLIGYPLGHSFSKKYFTQKFEKNNIADAEYRNFEIENIQKFPEVINEHKSALRGLNVTIPYKQQVIPYLDRVSQAAKDIGAVNTVKIIKSGSNIQLEGHNTDVIGFERSLQPLLNKTHKKALILGTGGASKAVRFVLKKMGIEFISATIEELQTNEITYEQITPELIGGYTLIINATPLGTYPNIETYPEIPYLSIGKQHVLFDLVYNPEETVFLKKGKEQGAVIKNGLEMLIGQAEAAYEIWNA